MGRISKGGSSKCNMIIQLKSASTISLLNLTSSLLFRSHHFFRLFLPLLDTLSLTSFFHFTISVFLFSIRAPSSPGHPVLFPMSRLLFAGFVLFLLLLILNYQLITIFSTLCLLLTLHFPSTSPYSLLIFLIALMTLPLCSRKKTTMSILLIALLIISTKADPAIPL